ncbi:hypothetical protein [Bacteroides propionicifaciens]|uniref:hypothetical protein n=1 Tax=Bacteroides propionicifaciens TaxID=392838 RepID=UPI000361E62A|nr:hypothetical protein [Bacteroides propionicifaciens]
MNRIKEKLERNEQVTMADLREHKKAVLNQLRLQQEAVKTSAENIISPIANTGSSLISSFNWGMAAFDTIFIGFRAVKRILGLFARKSRRRY